MRTTEEWRSTQKRLRYFRPANIVLTQSDSTSTANICLIDVSPNVWKCQMKVVNRPFNFLKYFEIIRLHFPFPHKSNTKHRRERARDSASQRILYRIFFRFHRSSSASSLQLSICSDQGNRFMIIMQACEFQVNQWWEIRAGIAIWKRRQRWCTCYVTRERSWCYPGFHLSSGGTHLEDVIEYAWFISWC